MASLIDPTVAGKYPVILGDGLLGKTSNEIFTGIRYNHKPTLSSDEAPNHARLKPSLPGKTDSYDLTFNDDSGSYAYAGSRNTNSDQYVLHFDAERKAFVLDKIDSTFNMNITRLPGNSDPDHLRSQYAHLDDRPPAPKRGAAAPKKTPATKDTKSQAKEHKRKAEKKQQAKEVALSFPEPQQREAEKPKPKQTSFEDDEDEDEDDDGGLLVEYPGAETAKQNDFSPAFPQPRRFDDFMDQRESEADDADGESDDEPDGTFKLPSPVNHPASLQNVTQEEELAEVRPVDDGDDAMSDIEDDLAKDMEEAFVNMANTPGGGDESEISEED